MKLSMHWIFLIIMSWIVAFPSCSPIDQASSESSISIKSPEQISFFWDNLSSLCGKAFEGNLVKCPNNAKTFQNEKLILEVVYCSDSLLQLALYVGADRSRVIYLYNKIDQLELRHKHFNPDGTLAEESGYGGFTNNLGTHFIQVFPADEYTAQIAPAAASNIWWLELEPDKKLIYNLVRLGSNREFQIDFNIAQSIVSPFKPWSLESSLFQ